MEQNRQAVVGVEKSRLDPNRGFQMLSRGSAVPFSSFCNSLLILFNGEFRILSRNLGDIDNCRIFPRTGVQEQRRAALGDCRC